MQELTYRKLHTVDEVRDGVAWLLPETLRPCIDGKPFSFVKPHPIIDR